MVMIKKVVLLLSFLLVAGVTYTKQKKVEVGKFYGAKTVPMPFWFKQSFLEFSDDIVEAKDANRFVMIYFHQDGCPYCAKLIEDNFTNSALLKKLRSNFDVIEINLWGDREITDWQGHILSEKKFGQKMKVQFTPTLLFLDENANIILRLNGYQSVEKMHKILDYVGSNAYKKLNFSQYKASLTERKPLSSIAIQQPDYFDNPPFVLSRSGQLEAQQKLAVIFTNSACMECAEFHNQFILEPYNAELLSQMQVVQLDMNKTQNLITPNSKRKNIRNWYADLALTDLPAMVFFDEVGNEIIRKDAYLKSFHFQSVLHYVLDDGFKKFPSFQHYIEHRAQSIRDSGKDVNIWQ